MLSHLIVSTTNRVFPCSTVIVFEFFLNHPKKHANTITLKHPNTFPIHWGAFDLGHEPLQEPPTLLRQAAAEQNIADRVHLLDIVGIFSL